MWNFHYVLEFANGFIRFIHEMEINYKKGKKTTDALPTSNLSNLVKGVGSASCEIPQVRQPIQYKTSSAKTPSSKPYARLLSPNTALNRTIRKIRYVF